MRYEMSEKEGTYYDVRNQMFNDHQPNIVDDIQRSNDLFSGYTRYMYIVTVSKGIFPGYECKINPCWDKVKYFDVLKQEDENLMLDSVFEYIEEQVCEKHLEPIIDSLFPDCCVEFSWSRDIHRRDLTCNIAPQKHKDRVEEWDFDILYTDYYFEVFSISVIEVDKYNERKDYYTIFNKELSE